MFSRIRKMFRSATPINPRNFRFDRDRFYSCCQALIVHNLHYRSEERGTDLDPGLIEGMRQRLVEGDYVSGKMVLAITASDQVTAEAIFTATGFSPVHSWRAKTGSYLTLWVYKP